MSTARQWLSDFAATSGNQEQIAAFADIIRVAVIDSASDFPTRDAAVMREFEVCTTAHWRDFLIALGRDVFESKVPPEAEVFAREMVRRGYPLELLLAVYRTAQRAVWQYATAIVEERIDDHALRTAVLVEFWGCASSWLDLAVESLIATVEDEKSLMRNRTAERSAAIVHAILRGEQVDPDSASVDLGYRLRGGHRCLILWQSADHDLVALGRALGGRLVVPGGSGGVRCWLPGERIPSEEDIPDDVRAALGTAGTGIDGFIRTHAEASAAHSLTLAGRNATLLTKYEDVELACLAAGFASRAGVQTFVVRELGALVGDDEATTRLRETLLAYLGCEAHVRKTAHAISVHPNTVRYRIRQAEELIGHPATQRRAHLELALRTLDAFGSVSAIAD